ncbi:Mitochondrial-processing peptidase subunit beta [Balamuthia mandrillaris]
MKLFGLSRTSSGNLFQARALGKRCYAGVAEARATERRLGLPPYLLNQTPTQVTTLPNQLRVASEYRYGETATVGVWIDAGSAYEDERTNGVAHFLEHMAFKGTNNRTEKQIEQEIENMGGNLNAYTSREQTVYHAHVFKKDVGKAVEILADILQNSTFGEQQIERERGVILREMEEVESQTDEVIVDHLHSIAYQGSSLGYTILGPEKNIRNISKRDLTDYIETHYTAPRMVLAAAGAVDHEELHKLAEKHFGRLSSENKIAQRGRPPVEFVGSAVHVRNDDIPLVHTAIAVESVGWSDPNYFVFMVLQAMVGNWDRSLGGGKNLSSRVCEAFATEQLAHSLMSFNTCYHNTGLFGAYIVGEIAPHPNAIAEVVGEWVRIGQSATEAEVERAKNKLKSTFLMQLDGTSAICEDIGRQLLTLGRRLTPAEVYLRLDAITADQVRQVAYQYLNDVDPVVAAVGSVDAATYPDYNQIRGWTYWNRL